MSRRLLIVPTGHQVGLSSICLGLLRAADRAGLPVAYAKPITQPLAGPRWRLPDRAVELVQAATPLEPPTPIDQEEAEQWMAGRGLDRLMEEVLDRIGPMLRGEGLRIIEGLVPTDDQVYSVRVNQALASALDAEVVLVGASRGRPVEDVVEDFAVAAQPFLEVESTIAGCLLNKVVEAGEPPAGASVPVPETRPSGIEDAVLRPYREGLAQLPQPLQLRGAVPFRPTAASPRVSDVAQAMGAKVLFPGNMHERRVASVIIGAMSPGNFLDRVQPGQLIIVPGDRSNVLMAANLANVSGTPLAGILFTGGLRPDERIQRICRRALDGSLPLLSVADDTFEAATFFTGRRWHVPPDDLERAELVMTLVANHIDREWVGSLATPSREPRVSPAAFRHSLIERAQAHRRRIVLPEGDEPRTVRAAAICQDRGIAQCVLLGRRDAILRVAGEQGIHLPSGVEIIDPADVRDAYVAPLVELRKHKGMTAERAQEELEDPVVLGTMMLQRGEVHGLVSGAVHTTANTIRPALQLIKTAPGHHTVSSVFFMCLPDQVRVFGDCAVIPDPTSEELAEIAVQSADSAERFGVPVRVAMISYSTGTSGTGDDVQKVVRATDLVRAQRPDLSIDGPLQYDAAIHPDVARTKAPASPVAGRATVFVFPDLNTGNTTYKAVQRSARVVSIGPMLQGLAKPVNDLSRGALVEDIVYTIALTAIQAQ
jgi:phosphate acetyltransferase